MKDYSKFKASIENDRLISKSAEHESNPLFVKADPGTLALSNYTQELPRSGYDKDMSEIIESVRVLNILAPLRMPVYNFNLDEVNGECYYKPDGTPLLVREDDGDVIRDYYGSSEAGEENSVNRILEHDKNTGRLRVKIEPITRKGSRLRASITIFDVKINNKYTLIQLADDGIVNNITEFSGKGKSFRTLFRNIYTFKPVRYLEGRDNEESGFEMVDCIFDAEGNVARIKRYTNKREINITYTEEKKNITVKTKEN